MAKSGSSIKHFKKRTVAKSNVKSSQIRSYKKALKQSGYDDSKPRNENVKKGVSSSKKKTGFENLKNIKNDKKEEEVKNQARIQESKTRRANEKRTYSRSRGSGKSGKGGKLNLVSKVLLGRIEKRLEDDKNDKK
ncbi:hypothetical protein TrLO_g9941 [Triparma laevis f. longispina]|uniref:Uncharacterized protein n=1 Tax=Triparma laevis f. longispina TaxID=1714387 RepID=A0A9W7DN18_9STRA|nr:hypothetical protein TrLO_g9941 [Triparma laevis f. longispina]